MPVPVFAELRRSAAGLPSRLRKRIRCRSGNQRVPPSTVRIGTAGVRAGTVRARARARAGTLVRTLAAYRRWLTACSDICGGNRPQNWRSSCLPSCPMPRSAACS